MQSGGTPSNVSNQNKFTIIKYFQIVFKKIILAKTVYKGTPKTKWHRKVENYKKKNQTIDKKATPESWPSNV